MKTVLLTLIVIIVGLVILIRTRGAEQAAAVEPVLPPQVALEDVRPPVRPPAPKPEQPKPAAGESAAEPVVEPVQEALPVEPKEPKSADVEPMDKTSTQAHDRIERALNLRDEGKLIAARDVLNEALNMKLSPQVRDGVKLQLGKLADTWLFGRQVVAGDTMTDYYLVQPGDLLSTIGRRHKVPYEILMEINGIARPELLRAGQRIKIIHGPFNAVVNRTDFTLDLYVQNMYVKTYKVGLGRSEHTTPTGRWMVSRGGKMIKPTWTDPDTGRVYKGDDPDYPLGSRWIALDGIEGNAEGRTGFALHGTREPETIGTQSSRGCIRLHNGDVIELYNVLEPGQSYVMVMD